MSRPPITDDQKAIAIELLANALRKDAHLRRRVHDAAPGGGTFGPGTLRHRAASSQRYVDGMRDMLRMLFSDGHDAAEECLDAAYALAMGVSRPHHDPDPRHH